MASKTTKKRGAGRRGKSKGPEPSAEAETLRLVGRIGAQLSGCLVEDAGDPVREAAIEIVTESLHRLSTLLVLDVARILARFPSKAVDFPFPPPPVGKEGA